MKTAIILAISALAAASFTAQADEADSSQYALQFTSVRSASDVRAEAINAPKITNGGTGFVGLTNSTIGVAEVKVQTLMALRNGQISRGETGPM